MRQLSAKAARRAEDHLLICPPCRQKLEASDVYVAAMRLAASKLRRAERKPKPLAAVKAPIVK